MIDSGDIKVSKKTLLHVSEGIYRSFGSALKEIINNGFDANAKSVRINTNFPQFDFISIQDDGDGMQVEEFLRIVSGGIGDSKKAAKSDQQSIRRPVIGRLGIGILAIAQICRSFTIISHHPQSKSAFKGRMIFNPSVDEVAKSTDLQSDYPAGKWELIEKPKYDESKKGVLIYTDDLRQTFTRIFREKTLSQNDSPLKFEDYFKSIYESNFYPSSYKSIQEISPYHQLIFELCNLLPISYFEGTPIRSKLLPKIDLPDENLPLEFIKEKNDELEKYTFSVFVDQIRLYKIIKLPFPEKRHGQEQDCQLFYFDYDNNVRNRRLKFRGYFFAQEFAIYPRELNGIQIRIKNVGIGLHDSSFLGYDKIDSPRDKWISGEVYVEEGLESALNIDRDSFNENDEHFYVLRREVHKKLQNEVLPYVKVIQTKRNKSNRENKALNSSVVIEKQLLALMKISFKSFRPEIDEDNEVFFVDTKNKVIRLPGGFSNPRFLIRRDALFDNLFEIIHFLETQFREEKAMKSFLLKISKILLTK